MSKRKSDALFYLIKSLTKSEKRHFKLHVSRLSGSEDMKFIKLFKLIEKQKEFDEDRILKQDTSIKPEQLSNLKAHLYTQILNSIRYLSAPKIIDVEIRDLIDKTQILYNKCLYVQADKMILKAKNLAEHNENLSLMMDVLKWEQRISTQLVEDDYEDRIDLVINELLEVNRKINNINSFSFLSTKLNFYYQKIGFIRDEDDFNDVREYFNKMIPEYEEENLSFDEKIYLNNAFVGYYFFIQDFKSGHDHARKILALFDNSPEMIGNRLEMYVKALNSLLVAQFKLAKYNEFVLIQNRLNSISKDKSLPLTQNIELILFKYYYVHEINRYFLLGEFHEGISLIATIEIGLDKFIDTLDQHHTLVFYYKIACLYFGAAKYPEAIIWLNKIINMKNVDLREDIHCFSRILNLISHFELGNTELLDYYIKSVYRFLFKKDDLHMYQQNILGFLKNLKGDIGDKELIIEFRNLRTRLLELINSPYEKRAFIYFDIISWLESKIEKIPVAEIIQRKAQKRLKRA
ncbi:MAG: hypothetical protein HRT72_03585 [Flavobacteriales bacterium]|nr:hypothetical protein [Flavobacteriales bacterium]